MHEFDSHFKLNNAPELKEFLELNDSDIQILTNLHDYLKKDPSFFVDQFYAHLLKFEFSKFLIPDKDTLTRLKKSQTQYFTSLTSGEYGEDYLRDRFQVGRAHQKIGLEPRWYIGAYRKYLSQLIPQISLYAKSNEHDCLQAIQSILKVVFLDIAIAMESYIDKNSEAIARRAEQLSTLSEMAIAVNATLGVNETLNEVMKCAMNIVKAQASTIVLFDVETRSFTEKYSRGLSPHFVKNMSFRRNGLADDVFNHSNYILSNDLPETKYKLSQLAREEGIASFVCLPLVSHKRRLGVQYLYFHHRQQLYDDEYALLSTLSHIATGAIGNAHLHTRAVTLSMTDSLTNLFNRREFMVRIEQELLRSRHSKKPFSVIMADIDHFKDINDSYGHPTGDMVLTELAQIFLNITRDIDIVARFGGEEFIFLLPGIEGDIALQIAERIRKTVEQLQLRGSDKKLIDVRISMGISCYPKCAQDEDNLVKNADAALYAAKNRGRNQTVLFSDIATQNNL
ncbi:diguanylate cyclase/phosphodiesterase (GGDEF & EAL domains) with PAS/PAC sensor(s) [hydrothermal vent metagenome]|uniref:Diguanylate cyclase DosC n=1 Tax=hydrothermal vent metagenome TaxID=652676 RepID=A0A3B1BNB5_9ZZZZ